MNVDQILAAAERATVDEDGAPKLTFRSAADVVPTRPEWRWERWLCSGALHLCVGRQGHGKSTFAAWVVGNSTTGRPFPGDPTARDPIACGVLSLEESADRLVGRMHATGADVGKVLVLGDVQVLDDDGRPYRRPWCLPEDCSALERLVTDQALGLVVVDGLGYTVSGDSHNYGVVGSALSALAGVAERTGCAIVGLTHPPKGSSDPTTVAIGSTAWTAVARVVWLLGVDPEDETGSRRVVQVSKSNFKLPDAGISFSIGDDPRFECGFVTGISASHVTAEALASASVPADERTEREDAREIVRAILNDGPMETAEFIKLTRNAGMSDRTVERARRDLGVRATSTHDGRRIVGWKLALPDKSTPTPPPTPPLPDRGALGGLGGVALNRGDVNRPRIKTANPANPAEGTLAGGVEPFFDRDEF